MDEKNLKQEPDSKEPAEEIKTANETGSEDTLPVEELSAEEQAKILVAQQKADTKYHDVLGDRRIKKPSRLTALIITIAVVVLLVVYIIVKLPMFYGCMTPSSTDTIASLLELTDSDDFDGAEVGDVVWYSWYETNSYGVNTFNYITPLGDDISEVVFVSITENTASIQVNLLCGVKQDSNTFEEGSVQYVTVIMYQFSSVSESTAYGVSMAEELGGEHEFKDLWFFKIGAVQATTDDFIYTAWYNGGTYIEIYSTNSEAVSSYDAASVIRTLINYNS